MAYNTKPIIKDVDGNPISQYYDPITDSYKPVEGSSGGNKVVLYNEDGTTNDNLSLEPILDKLEELTGTVIDSSATLNLAKEYTDEEVGIITDDLVAHKLNYIEQRQQDNLKVAKVEKDINDYQQVMSQVNVNQEAKQSATGYGAVSLPKNSANGQVSVSVKGLTATNLIKNGNFSNGLGHWNKFPSSDVDLSIVANKLQLKLLVSGGTNIFQVNQQQSLATSDKYYISLDTFSNVNASIDTSLGEVGTDTIPTAHILPLGNTIANSWVRFSLVRNGADGTDKIIVGKRGPHNHGYNVGDYVQLKNFICINLTQAFGAGSEPTVEECDKMFSNYFDDTKSTISASRLKSVGKNLFDKNKIILQSRANIDTGDIETLLGYKRSPFIKVLSNKKYTRVVENNVIGHYISWYDSDKNYISRTTSTLSENPQLTSSPINAVYAILNISIDSNIDTIQLEQSDIATPYEPYTESTQYLPNVGELRSLPNGVSDEVRVSGGKAEKMQKVSGEYVLREVDIKSISTTNESWNMDIVYLSVLNNQTMSIGTTTKLGQVLFKTSIPEIAASERYTAYAPCYYHSPSGLITIGVPKGTYTTVEQAKTGLAGLELTYQLAEPIITPINVSGTLLSNPSGTVYVEKVVADAGIYTTKFNIKELQLPIKSIDKLIKYNFETGVQTVLDTSLAVINEDNKSFTHPNLTDKDMVFVDYFYDVESTLGETTIEYLDSRHTIKDSVNNKFYSWSIKSTNGVPTVELTEVL